MKLTSAQASELVGVSSAVAGVGELHEMKMQGGVMKMQARTSLALAAGVAQELKPGGFHLMLMDLKQTLPAGSTVPLVLTFKDASGKTTQQSLNVPVALRAPGQGEKDHKQGVDHHGADKHGGHKHGAHQH